MKSTARVISMDDHRTSGPQLEDGHIRIANELFDSILRFCFTLKQQNVVLAVMRKTYGYGKKVDDVSAAQIGELCGMSRNHVTETLNELAAMNVITKAAGKYGCLVGINKRHNEWRKAEKSTPKSATSTESGLVPDRDVTSPESGLSLVPNQDCSIVPNQDTQKTTFQKTTPKDNLKKDAHPSGCATPEDAGDKREAFDLKAALASLPNLSAEVAADYIKFRKSIKKPLTATAWKLIAKQVELSGWAPDDALAEAQAAGWQGLKAEWLKNRAGHGAATLATSARRTPQPESFATKDYGQGGLL